MIIRRSSGNWTLWDRKSILHNDLKLQCQWTIFRPAHITGNTQAAPMCLFPRERDVWVSGSIMDQGRWLDCDDLTLILRKSKGSNERKRIHVEIGANIGSCVMQVLLTTDADVYAFEPHPHNLFHLTSTLMNLGEAYLNRVYLFPIALGKETGFSRIVMDDTNSGNSQVVDTSAPQGGFTIPIEQLDDILDMSQHPITLMKMDAEGYECYILGGMKKTLQFTKNLVFEVERKQLKRFKDCSPSSLVNIVKGSGFTLYKMPFEGINSSSKAYKPDFDNFRSRHKQPKDLLATRE